MYNELVKRLREYAKEHCPLNREFGICGCIDSREAADAIKELVGKVEQWPRWIPVTERLPEKNGPYLCCWKASADEKRHIARVMVWRADTGWMNAWDEPMSKYVTHWMPLPQPPEEG